MLLKKFRIAVGKVRRKSDNFVDNTSTLVLEFDKIFRQSISLLMNLETWYVCREREGERKRERGREREKQRECKFYFPRTVCEYNSFIFILAYSALLKIWLCRQLINYRTCWVFCVCVCVCAHARAHETRIKKLNAMPANGGVSFNMYSIIIMG